MEKRHWWRISDRVPEKFEMCRVRKVINLLGLPGTQPFTIVVDAVVLLWGLKLFREHYRICGDIERFGGQNSGRLMVIVVLARNVQRQPGQDNFRPRQPDQPNHLLQRSAMPPGLEGVQNVLSGRVQALKEPNVEYSHGRQRATAFYL